ncbi:MAG: CHASE3 domain-containing protein [Ilumatobacteraceae bacterium]
MGNGHRRQSSLRTRLGIIALVFLVMVLIAVGLSTLMIRSWDRTLDRRGEARAASVAVAELSLSLSDQETGIRGYLLTGDPSFLEPYRDGAMVEADIVERLHGYDLDLPGFDALVDGAVDAGEVWRADVAEPILADVADAPPDAIALERFDAVRLELDELDAAVVSHADDLADQARRMQRNVIGVLFLSARRDLRDGTGGVAVPALGAATARRDQRVGSGPESRRCGTSAPLRRPRTPGCQRRGGAAPSVAPVGPRRRSGGARRPRAERRARDPGAIRTRRRDRRDARRLGGAHPARSRRRRGGGGLFRHRAPRRKADVRRPHRRHRSRCVGSAQRVEGEVTDARRAPQPADARRRHRVAVARC